MRLKKIAVFTLIVLLCLSLVSMTGCSSQKKEQYPSKAIEYVVHSSPGGSSDIFTRMVADILAKEGLIKVPITVVNKTGGGGAVAYKYTASKVGDPYVLQNIPSTFITTPQISKDCPNYEEFTTIALLAVEPDVIVVNAESPYKTLDDLVAASKTKAEGITFSVASVGSYDHLAQLLFAKECGGKVVGLPFTSDTEAMVAVLGNHADASAVTPRVALPQIQAGELRVLAISSEKRTDMMPDVPTLKELGMDIVIGTPRGVAAPKDIPEDAETFLLDTYKKLSTNQRWLDYLKKEYLLSQPLFGEDYRAFLKAETERTGPLLKEAGLIK